MLYMVAEDYVIEQGRRSGRNKSMHRSRIFRARLRIHSKANKQIVKASRSMCSLEAETPFSMCSFQDGYTGVALVELVYMACLSNVVRSMLSMCSMM